MKIMFITNVLTPYRVYFFDELNTQLKRAGGELKVLVMLAPDHNLYWNYNDYKREYTCLLPVWYAKAKSDFFINFGLKKQIDEFNPEYVVGCGAYWYPTIIHALYICRKYRIKMLYWSESNKIRLFDKKGIQHSIREFLRKATYCRMDGFIYPGKYALDLIHDYNKRPNFLFQLPNVIDYHKYTICEQERDTLRQELKIDRFVLFCPARLSYEKGVIPFLKLYASSDLSKRSTLYIAGKGPDEKEAEQIIRDNKLNVVLLGYINQEIMIKYYHACDFFVLPSLSDASPLTCVEAAWCGSPMLLSSAIGNLPEVLEEGKNGFVFHYEEEKEAVALLNRIIELDDEWYTNAHRISREIAEKTFRTEAIIGELINALESNLTMTKK